MLPWRGRLSCGENWNRREEASKEGLWVIVPSCHGCFSHPSFEVDSPIMSLYSKGNKSPLVKITPLIFFSSLGLGIQGQWPEVSHLYGVRRRPPVVFPAALPVDQKVQKLRVYKDIIKKNERKETFENPPSFFLTISCSNSFHYCKIQTMWISVSIFLCLFLCFETSVVLKARLRVSHLS